MPRRVNKLPLTAARNVRMLNNLSCSKGYKSVCAWIAYPVSRATDNVMSGRGITVAIKSILFSLRSAMSYLRMSLTVHAVGGHPRARTRWPFTLAAFDTSPGLVVRGLFLVSVVWAVVCGAQA